LLYSHCIIKKIIDFITYEIWHKTERDFSGKRWWAVKQLRVILFTARGFGRHDTAIRSAALSFFTIMSLVPILALVFVIFRGFGMDSMLIEKLYELLPQYTEIVDLLVGFINNLLVRTKGGVMAVSAFFVLIWAVIQVFGNVEGAFNKIWEVKRSRAFSRRFSTYMALVILVPILMISANSLYVGIRGSVENITGNLVAEILFGVASVAIMILMFSIVYFVLPNTTVKFQNALKAGIVAGIGFSIFQVGYVYIQGNLSSYNAIYGTFAAIPLFLVWMQTSWQILLFGGELSFAMQNIHDFESEQQAEEVSHDNRCKIMIGAMVVVIHNYMEGVTSTSEHIARETGAPVRTVREVVRKLEEDGMLLFVENDAADKTETMVPARDPGSIRFFDVINAVSGHGDTMLSVGDTPLMKRVDEIYEKVRAEVGTSTDNIPLTELIK
jgi:membrane protein